jgi:L-amino acid N-acyltransferase YncA
MPKIHITSMTAADWPQIAAISQQGIDSGNATFEVQPSASWETFSESKINACSIVARAGEQILGWAALSPVSRRKVYGGVAEVSIYIALEAQGKGIGSQLLAELIRLSEAQGIWTLQAGIFPENQASLNLHFKHGFRQVGVREKIGRMEFGPYRSQWRDVIFLERRSKIAGV